MLLYEVNKGRRRYESTIWELTWAYQYNGVRRFWYWSEGIEELKDLIGEDDIGFGWTTDPTEDLISTSTVTPLG